MHRTLYRSLLSQTTSHIYQIDIKITGKNHSIHHWMATKPAKEQDSFCMKDEALTALKTTVKLLKTLVRLEFYSSFFEKKKKS